MLSVSKNELNKALEHFYNVTGIKIVMYDSERRIITTYPETFEPYCTVVRCAPALKKRCLGCDNTGFDVCDATRRPYIYKCHMHITEAIAPIIANGVIIGYLLFGQVLCGEDEKAAYDWAVQAAEDFGFDKTNFLDKLAAIKRATPEYLSSALEIMSMCAGYLYTSEIIKQMPDILAAQLRDYINAHLSEELSSELLCHKFFISRSKLYKISVSEFGTGIMEHIKKERLELAARKLETTTAPISHVAYEVGIPDTNYFIRVFKGAYGITPRAYRRKYQFTE
ncbi:MAG: helix-turn-helix domain-containing protein [Ruminococcaceae bacterium]|nr:helix-turn-helix domain-containing protein [Oscillospiraceae bacterium]